MRKIFKVIISLFICLSLFSCVKKPKEDVYIFFTSDVHCGVEDGLGYPALKALVDEAKNEGKNVLLLDDGDFIQGGNLGSFSKGEIMIELMNAMGYDYATLGNHEFDYGMNQLKDLIDKSNFEYIVCNMEYTGKNENPFKDLPKYVIKEFGGTKIGIIGVATPESITSSTPRNFMEDGEIIYDFGYENQGKELANRVQKVVDEIKSKKVDYVVALTHLGTVEANRPYDAITFIGNTTGIDVVIDGHSHSVIYGEKYFNADKQEVLLCSVGTKMENAGEIIITADGDISSLLISEYDKKDEQIQKLIDEENSKIAHILSEYICDLDFDLSILNENGIRQVRSRETSAGNFVADAMRYVGKSDIGIVNGGGVRASIEKGQVTFGSLNNVSPFANTIVTVKATGQQIIDCLEYGAQKTQALSEFDGAAVGEYGGFIQVSGLKYTINTDIESTVNLDGNGMLESIGENRRVSDVYVLKDGEYVEIDKDAYYTVSGSDYIMLSSGDGNTVFKDCENITEVNVAINDALKQYALEIGFLDEYRQTEGRITIK